MKGAAILPLARTTGRVLVGLRSRRVPRPLTWAPFSGHTKRGETPKETALRELAEETGYTGPMVLRQAGPRFFVAIVPDEFPPILNWEHEDAAWLDPDVAQALMED